MLDALTTLFERELTTLVREIEAYPDDESVWREAPGVPNSGGTLALHMAGNLHHLIGTLLGGSEYVRDREGEFGRWGVGRAEILREVEAARVSVRDTLAGLDPDRLDAPYPLAPGGRTLRTLDFLMHLQSHLAFHLGQIDYHRRILSSSSGSVEPVPISELRGL